MNQIYGWLIFLGTALVYSLLPMLQGCADNQNETPITWDSAKMREIKKEWQLLWDTYEKQPGKIQGNYGKAKFGNTTILVDRLFRKRFSEKDLHQLAASCDMLPARVEDWGFSSDVLAFIVKSFVDLGKRDSLVELLSIRCPNWIDYPEHIEFYLAFRGKKFQDPILILGEAYAKCGVPETRQTLADAIRRSFAGFEIGGKDDAEYVKNAMQWYQKEKSHLIANSKYEIAFIPSKRTLFIEAE